MKSWPSLEAKLGTPPVLEEVEGGAEASDAYAADQEIAARVDAFHAELVALDSANTQLTGRDSKAYGLYLNHWRQGFDLNNRLYDRTFAALYGLDLPQKQQDARVWQAYVDYARGEQGVLEDYRKKVPGLGLPGEIGASVESHLQEEADDGIALAAEFRAYLRKHPPGLADVSLYNGPLADYDLPAGGTLLTAFQRRGELTRTLVDGVADLTGQAGAGAVEPGGPFVGDAYREQIIEISRHRTKPEPTWLEAQLWMLHRIREIEDTPEEAYAEARATIYLQAEEDEPRNYFQRLLPIIGALRSSAPAYGDRDDKRSFESLRTWALDQLSRPAPTFMEPTRRLAADELEGITTTDADEALYQDMSKLLKRFERALRDDARTLDGRRKLESAVRRAVEGTLPATE